MSGDTLFANDSLLLLCNGTNGSTTFTDTSNSAFTQTAVGNAQISTTSPKYGTGSMLLDGTGDWVTTQLLTGTAFSFGSGQFTFDFWIKTSKTTNYCPIGMNYTFGDPGSFVLLVNSFGTGSMRFHHPSGTNRSIPSTDINDGNWNHVAIQRETGDVLRIYLRGVCLYDGSSYGTTTSQNYGNTNVGMIFGTQMDNTGLTVNGNLDCIRITKGVARWPGTGTFTPPTSEADYLPFSRRVILVE